MSTGSRRADRRVGAILWMLVLLLGDISAQVNQCGRHKTSRIMGGYTTYVNEYPMMAGLVYNRAIMCGATIISQSHVVSAAHCFSSRSATDFTILVGDHDLATGADTPYSAVYRAAYVIIHSQYTGRDVNDIAILKSSSTIQFNAGVGPVCLPYGTNQFVGQYVDAVGWGTYSYGGPRATVLQKVSLQVISNDECQETYGNRIQPSLICTEMYRRDACQYDSGGPLFTQQGGLIYLAGIIAFGTGCGGSAPGVSTRVTSFSDWIRANMY